LLKEDFIKRLTEDQKERNDYSEIKEKFSSGHKISIKCIKHNKLFFPNAGDHLNKKTGCPECKKEKLSNLKRMSIEEFVTKANLKHNNKFDYSKVILKTGRDKVEIICPIHGSFWVAADPHINQSTGCPNCWDEKRAILNRERNIKGKHTRDHFIEESKKVHGDLYNYSLVHYNDSHEKVKIICPIHGIFEIAPHNHIHNGNGCKKCVDLAHTSNTDEFIQKAKAIHGDKYDYSNTKYTKAIEEIEIICEKHGPFITTPNRHLCGNGCTICRTSNAEMEVADFIKENYSGEILQRKKTIIPPYELDIFLPEMNLAIEYNGLYWHSSARENIDKNYHLMKTNMCEEKGIHLIHIYEDEWLIKKEIVKSRLLNILGKSNKIFARECIIKEITATDSCTFQENNHIQGKLGASTHLGLFYNEEIVSIMTFGQLRKSMGRNAEVGTVELLRFCNKLNVSVIGGANKLFRYYLNNFKPKKVISYANRSWTMNNGNSLYEQMGFILKGITKPNYDYVVNGQRKSRFTFRKDVLIKEGYDKNKSEREIMEERNIHRIYNSGNLLYEYVGFNHNI
jgi:hypothetical protein